MDTVALSMINSVIANFIYNETSTGNGYTNSITTIPGILRFQNSTKYPKFPDRFL